MHYIIIYKYRILTAVCLIMYTNDTVETNGFKSITLLSTTPRRHVVDSKPKLFPKWVIVYRVKRLCSVCAKRPHPLTIYLATYRTLSNRRVCISACPPMHFDS